MKINCTYVFLALFFAIFMTQGFSCGSPEFAGAKVAEKDKLYTKAVKLYEKEVQDNPTNYEAWFRLGRIRGEQFNNFAGMNDAFNKAEKLNIDHSKEIREIRYRFWGKHVNNGVGYMKRAGNDSIQYYDNAIEEYKTAIIIWPDTSMTYSYLAVAYHGKGDADNEIVSLKKLWEMRQDKEAYTTVGQLYAKHGLDKKEQFKKENADKLKLQNDLNEINKGSYKTDVKRVLGSPDITKKEGKNSKKEEWTYNQYSLTLTVEGERVVSKKFNKPYDLKIDSTNYFEAVSEFNKAVDVYEAVKKLYAKDNDNLKFLLQAYLGADRTKEATAAFRLAVDNEPGNKMNHYILGYLYGILENYNEAIAEFNEAIKIDPDFGEALYDLGKIYYNLGVKLRKIAQEEGKESAEYKEKLEAALPSLEKYSQIKKDDPMVWEMIGTIYANLGKNDKAMKALDEADKIRKSGN